MTRQMSRILFVASIALIIGIIVAYYNTASLGYDNANIISFNNEEIRVFAYNIKYSQIHYIIEIIKKFLPSILITI